MLSYISGSWLSLGLNKTNCIAEGTDLNIQIWPCSNILGIVASDSFSWMRQTSWFWGWTTTLWFVWKHIIHKTSVRCRMARPVPDATNEERCNAQNTILLVAPLRVVNSLRVTQILQCRKTPRRMQWSNQVSNSVHNIISTKEAD